MMPTLDQLNRWTRHYAVLQGVGDYRFAVAIVPGLTHEGTDAWAVVRPDPETRTALVQVRDIDATPIHGFDGDPNFEIRVTISHEMFHVLLAEWLANPTIDNEERVVEAAAQAVVRSEFGSDARIVARSIVAIPTAIRARVVVATRSVSARASRRRERGRKDMDPELKKKALDALLADDGEAIKEILKAIVTDAPADSEGKAPSPAREDAGGEQAPAGPPAPDARGGYAREEDPPMARGRKADAEHARARRAADGTVSIFARARVRELRAEGFALDAALEKELVAERDPDVLERRIADLTRGRAMGSTGGQRARSGVEHEGAPAPANGGAAPMTAAQLAAEGFDAAFIADYQKDHRADPESAAVMLAGGRSARARKVAADARARAARTGV